MTRFTFIPLLVLTIAVMTGCQSLSPPMTNVDDTAKTPTDTSQLTGSVEKKDKPEITTPANSINEKNIQTPSHLNGRLVLGLEETGYLPHHNLSLKAKLDTGAATSSIDARGYQLFERDGKRWVKFELHRSSKGDIPMEYPVKDLVKIKRPGEEAVSRPVIDMTIRIGDVTQKIKVNLNDRDNYEYPLLVGRNFIQDLAVIDVDQKNIAEEKLLKASKQTLTLKNAKTQQPPKNQMIKQSVSTAGLVTLGAVENVFFTDTGTQLKARIDTGAKTSSLDARNIKIYKKLNNEWVQFNMLGSNDKTLLLDYPVSRFVRIKRHGLPLERRPVIKLNVQIGSLTATTEFTLRDRSDYDFPVLIGEQLLKNHALVDVSKEYTGKPPIPYNNKG